MGSRACVAPGSEEVLEKYTRAVASRPAGGLLPSSHDPHRRRRVAVGPLRPGLARLGSFRARDAGRDFRLVERLGAVTPAPARGSRSARPQPAAAAGGFRPRRDSARATSTRARGEATPAKEHKAGTIRQGSTATLDLRHDARATTASQAPKRPVGDSTRRRPASHRPDPVRPGHAPRSRALRATNRESPPARPVERQRSGSSA